MYNEIKIEENTVNAYQLKSLVVEENTIYEIDEECMNCLELAKKKKEDKI